jgi:hypothetical protein
MVAEDAFLMSAMRYIQAAALAFLVLAIFVGYLYVNGLSHKARAAMLQSQLTTCQTELAIQTANNYALRGAIDSQNAAVDAMKQEADQRRKAALAARDAALEALQQTQGDYARLREDWPADCVSAVDRVREELGL